MGAVVMMLAPFLAVLAWLSPYHAVAAMVGIVIAAASTIRIQLWFRAQAKRPISAAATPPRASPPSPRR